MHKSTKILLSVFLTLALVIGGFFLFYTTSPLPSVKGDYKPNVQQKISYNAPLSLEFSHKMNRKMTESAVQIAPQIEGTFSWKDGYTLLFTPKQKFEIGSKITVTIAKTAQDYLGKNLVDDLEMHFLVIGAPRVIFVSPVNQAELLKIKGETVPEEADRTPVVLPYSPSPLAEYPKMPEITVMFDRPIRALTTLDESDANQQIDFLKIEPALQGEFKWLGTSAIQFTPTKLPMSTKFEITIPKGAQILDSGFTEEDFVWHFETEEPRLLASEPQMDEQFFDPKNQIKLHFNQQVNLDTLYQGLNFYPPEDGFFNGEIFFEKNDLNTVIIEPKPKLVHPENYTLSVKKGIRGFDGTKASEQEISIKFKTYDQAGVKNSSPQNKATNVKNYEIFLDFNTPMLEESLKEKFSVKPTVSDFDFYLSGEEGTRAEINGSFKPGETYQLTLKKGAKDKFEQIIREDFSLEFTMADASPYFSLLARGEKGLFSEKIPPEYYLRSINLKKIEVEFCQIDEAEFLKTEKDYNWYGYLCAKPEKWSMEIGDLKNVYQTTPLPLEDKIHGKGIYFLSVASPEYLQDWDKVPYRYNQVFFVTDTALSLKHSENESLVWATDLISGEPIEKMQIQIKNIYTGDLIAQGLTNSDGIFQTKFKNSESFYVFANKDAQWGVVGSSWSEGIYSWDFGIPHGWYEDQRSFGYLYTDRPIYRPDQEVFFKGIVRQETDVKFSLPTEKQLTVEIEDAFGKKVLEENLPLNPNGSFNGKLKLDATASVGQYYLSARYQDNYFSRVFWVEEYRKPEFKVEIEKTKNAFVNQENLKATIRGSYYFGGALADAPVSWTITSDSYYFDQYEDEWYNFSADDNNYWGCGWWNECQAEQSVVATGEGKLDVNGKLPIEQKINLDKQKMSQLYTISATITDLNNQQITKQETVIVHKGDFYVGIKNEDYVAKTGEKAKFKIITVDPTGAVLKNKTVNLDFYKREWNSVQKEGIDGSFYWESENKDTLVSSAKALTDGNGKATLEFTPKTGGYYIAKAKALDEKGNEILAQGSVYVSGGDYIGWGVQNHDRIDLVLDKASYEIGDTANILVKSPFEESVKALFTIERQGILSSKILTLKNNSEIIKLPITAEMLPNIYVSVLLFKGSGEVSKVLIAQQELAEIEAKITEKENEKKAVDKNILELKAEIKAMELEMDAEAEPSARYQIRLEKLKTAETELEKTEQSLIEILAQKEAKNTEIKELKKTLDSNTLAKIEAEQFTEFPRPEFKLGYKNILVNTESKRLNLELQTDKTKYHAGEKVKLQVKTTDQAGKGVSAEVSIAVVDESILALKSRNLEDLVDFFYERRGLKIENAQSLVYFIERLNVKAQQGEKGGGGGTEESLLKEKRGDFKDTAFWEPNLETNTGGMAEVEFTLPDNLTTWQILAIGATKETLVGSTEKDFISTQDLIVRPVLPRFLVMNDTVEIGAIVHNNTGETQNVKVALTGENFANLDDSSEKIIVQDGQEAKVTWKIRVNQSLAKNFVAKFNFEAEASEYKDAVVSSLPIKSFSIPEVVSTNGVTEDFAKEKVYLPDSIDPTMGEVNLSVTPTLATNLKDGLEFLAEFPYGCAEQTMSRHLPNVVLKQIEKIIPLEGDAGGVVPDLDKMVSEGLQKLYQFQRYDGGWGYWTDSDYSYPYLSAYVLFGLNETKKAGYSVDAKVLEKGALYLKQYLNNPQQFSRYQELNLDDQAFALWVLSQVSAGDLALSLKLMDSSDDLSLYAKGYLWMDFMELARTETAEAVQKTLQEKISLLKTEIENSAIIDPRGLHFEEKKQNYWSMNSNTRTTAILLKALVQNDVQNPLIPKIIDWLRTQKQNGHWSNTQETVWALIAFTDFLAKSGELEADYNAKINLNGKEKMNQNFNAENIFTRANLLTEIKDLRLGLPMNEIYFSKEGKGKLYYDITAKYYLPLEEIAERSEGLTLIRSYSALEDKTEKAVVTPKVGEILKGKLTIIAPEDRHFVLVEEFLPAGFEGINFNLETENQLLQEKINRNEMQSYWWENGIWRFYHREFRDDRISLFADFLPAGIYEYEFLVRVTSAGTFHHLPAQAYEMYFPENFGRTSGGIVEVKEEI